MKHPTKDDIATFLITLSISLIPGAAIAEIGGQKGIARSLLWCSSASLGGTLLSVPGIKKGRTSTSYLEGQIKEYLADNLSRKYPRHNTQRLIELGAKFSRRVIRYSLNRKKASSSRVDPRHAYLMLLYLIEYKALKVYMNEDESLGWLLDWSKIPKLFPAPSKAREKCFSCRYWIDLYGVNEASGKRPNELTCAVNPLNNDTQNGCSDYLKDNLKADLRPCLARDS